MGTRLSSKPGTVKGGEEEWRPTSVTPLPGTSWLFNSYFPDSHYDHGTAFTFNMGARISSSVGRIKLYANFTSIGQHYQDRTLYSKWLTREIRSRSTMQPEMVQTNNDDFPSNGILKRVRKSSRNSDICHW